MPVISQSHESVSMKFGVLLKLVGVMTSVIKIHDKTVKMFVDYVREMTSQISFQHAEFGSFEHLFFFA